jgi:Plasmid pRiA4b ORF-3-like protein
MQEQIQAAISGLGPAEMKDVLQRLLAAPNALNCPLERPPPRSRRQLRRDGAVTYRVRVDLNGTKPPLWRRLELASDLFLDQVHEIMQAAFGWTDSHLHQFGSGAGRCDPGTEHYLCPFQVEEGDPGVPEEDVRLDEVLTEPGDKLSYEYDFGDGWQHTITLEAILPRPSSGPRAVCITGRRDGPPEDCGGVGAYELICADLDKRAAGQACWDTKTALRRLGALTGGWRSEVPTTDGVTFARAALQSWPAHRAPAITALSLSLA